MEIRKLERNEHGKTKVLYQEVFSSDSQGFVDYYYTEKVKDNQMYVMEEDDKIVGMLHLNPYTLKVNGLEKETNYIVAVATKEEYRKQIDEIIDFLEGKQDKVIKEIKTKKKIITK